MNAVRILFTILLALSLPCAVFLILYAYKRRTMPGAYAFILLMVSAIFYNSAYIGELNANQFSAAFVWYLIEHLFIPVQHYLWLVMSLEFAQVKKVRLAKLKYGMLYHPLLYLLIFFTNSYHHLYVTEYRFESNGFFPVIFSEKGPLFMVMVASGSLICMICTVAYVRGFLKVSVLHRNSYLIMIIASILPWVSVYLNASNLNYLGIDYFPVVSIFSGFLYMLGIFHYRIFYVVPIANEMIFRQSKDGILLVDLMDRIIDANDMILNLYPNLKKPLGKETLTAFLKVHTELSGLTELGGTIQFQRSIEDRVSYYSAEITQIATEEGIEIGKLLVMSNVTLFVENQQRLETIATDAIGLAQTNEISFLQAQIKPHFLNNTLSVIASMIAREPEKAKNLIGDLSEYLMSCCYFDNTSDMILLENELETVRTYVGIEQARFRDRLQFHLHCENLPRVCIPRLILQPLVENAIRHGILKTACVGNVWLTVRCIGDRVCFEVKDDGVGISEEKLQTLLTGTVRGQGIGLTNIHKRLLKYYGEGLKITSRSGHGTLITFSIPEQGVREKEKMGALIHD
jgi:two-component system LytT family sensor kinase